MSAGFEGVLSLDERAGLSLSAEAGAAFEIDPAAAYLVTGGLGGLGLEIARWLAEQGARHLILTSRRGVTDANRAAVEALEGAGVDVRVRAADVADPEGMAATIGRRSGRLGRFGHVHLAEADQREVTERRYQAAFRELHAVRAGEPFGIARPGELGGAEAERTHHRL